GYAPRERHRRTGVGEARGGSRLTSDEAFGLRRRRARRDGGLRLGLRDDGPLDHRGLRRGGREAATAEGDEAPYRQADDDQPADDQRDKLGAVGVRRRGGFRGGFGRDRGGGGFLEDRGRERVVGERFRRIRRGLRVDRGRRGA